VAINPDFNDDTSFEDNRLDDDKIILEIYGSLINMNLSSKAVEPGHFSVCE
jgi:hypothetical protein